MKVNISKPRMCHSERIKQKYMKLCLLDMAEELLTVVMILIEPGHDVDRSDQVDGTECFS